MCPEDSCFAPCPGTGTPPLHDDWHAGIHRYDALGGSYPGKRAVRGASRTAEKSRHTPRHPTSGARWVKNGPGLSAETPTKERAPERCFLLPGVTHEAMPQRQGDGEP